MGYPERLWVLRTRLDEAMANHIWWVVSLRWQGWVWVCCRVLPTGAVLILTVCVCSWKQSRDTRGRKCWRRRMVLPFRCNLVT